MSYLELLGLIVLVFFCTFVIVDRICKCLEQCATTKAFGKHVKNLITNDDNEENN